jgi:hypothetical protein
MKGERTMKKSKLSDHIAEDMFTKCIEENEGTYHRTVKEISC